MDYPSTDDRIVGGHLTVSLHELRESDRFSQEQERLIPSMTSLCLVTGYLALAMQYQIIF